MNQRIARIVKKLERKLSRLQARNRQKILKMIRQLSAQIATETNPTRRDDINNLLATALADLHRDAAVLAIIAQLEILREETGSERDYQEWLSALMLALLQQNTRKYLNIVLTRTPQTLRTYITHYDNAGRRVPSYQAQKTEVRNQGSYGELLLASALFFGSRSGFDVVRQARGETPYKMIVRVRSVTRERSGHAALEGKRVRRDTAFNFGQDGGQAMHLSELAPSHLINCGHVEVMV